MTASPEPRNPGVAPYIRYLAVIGGTIGSICGAILLVNFLVDPLWFHQGNRFSDHNHHYNERYSKINLFLQDPKKYDCVILGSSTATLMDAREIEEHTCINISFSQGHLKEYVDFLKFINRHVDRLNLVIVGLDGYHLVDRPFAEDQRVPPFIRNDVPLPSPLRTYIGLGPFAASVKNLLDYTVSGRTYDENFTAYLVDTFGPYRPEKERFNANFRQRFGHALGKFKPNNLVHVEELREVAPDARFVGYVPPISAHYMAYLKLKNKLDNYLETLYSASGYFDAFYDFTVPSMITKRSDLTNDGMHYSRQVNHQIADKINGKETDFGVKLQKGSFDDYRRLVIEATNSFMTEAEIEDGQQAAALRPDAKTKRETAAP